MPRALLAAMCVLVTTLNAQTAVTDIQLREYIHQALTANAGLDASRTAVSAARARIPQASAWEQPALSMTLMDVPSTSLNPFRDHMERFYQLEQMIPFPGKRGAATESASEGVRISEATVTRQELMIASQIKRLYAQIVAAQRRARLNASEQEILKQMVAAVEAKYSVGLAGQADILRLTIELRKLENERADIDQGRSTAIHRLNALRDRPIDETVGDLTEFSSPLPRTPVDSLTREASERHPSIVAARAEAAMWNAEARMASREYWPDLALGAGYRDRTITPDGWELMVGIRVPIAPWTSGMVSGRTDEATARSHGAERMTNDLQRMTEEEVRTMWQQMQTHWSQAERYRSSILPDAVKTLDVLRSSYQSGKTDFLSMVDGFRMLQMYSMEYSMELMDYEMSRAELEQAAGVMFLE